MSKPIFPCKPLMIALLLGGTLGAGSSQAAFLTDNQGQLANSADGHCVHTGDWQPGMGVCPAPTVVVFEQPATEVYALHDAEFFGFDSAQFGDLARARLYPLVHAARDADGVVQLQVTGHADPIGNAAYNRQLSMRRARAVRDYLVGEGLASDRIRVTAAGASDPVVDCATLAPGQTRIQCLAPDRRVDVVAVLRDNLAVTTLVALPPHA